MHKQKTIHVRAGAKLIFQDDGFIIAHIDKKAQLFFQKNTEGFVTNYDLFPKETFNPVFLQNGVECVL